MISFVEKVESVVSRRTETYKRNKFLFNIDCTCDIINYSRWLWVIFSIQLVLLYASWFVCCLVFMLKIFRVIKIFYWLWFLLYTHYIWALTVKISHQERKRKSFKFKRQCKNIRIYISILSVLVTESRLSVIRNLFCFV